ncbi:MULTISPECIES: cytochrome o ubiquinol oxidase subunit III [Brevibacillus]|uniref:Cytochrome bo(3) ubiquinol oxidase subunit 3 n=1 Tax=Brevibacillus invocatus TaxID=173959 RepID=A0A3M8BYW6_9BACL|nr:MULTISPECIES: cytochrome o ubiquinol oxidase subunit III [Brevibacillus]MCM3081529.1 cytochrome o ubiquinol oxidase subunit III [Brevibacillus invocatus]MCM3431902.1 cytochrome o ubiquinol oxidase subunit III [Brevibacillus invocatus]MDH4618689.1 cytochrome o ubiquinol oxidase subunit III [Brevibacillus sp. AY1]RNB68524.1 cytochrome o ubiquinol oxidase subunit III [Brevibacillus invocatus]
MQQVAKNHEHGHAHDHEHGHEEHEQLKVLGFWIFLVTDCILFGTLFATYAVMNHSFAGGPTGAELFALPGVIASTFILLTSSFTSGLAILAMNKGKVKELIGWLIVTALLGLSFIYLEVTEFIHLVHEGATIATSGFWSAFYTLVGTHGLHVSIGLFWMLAIIIQLRRRGLTPVTRRKVTTLSLYWHFLDVVWIFLFTVVYLMGVM